LFFQAEDGIRDFCLSRGLGDVYKRQLYTLRHCAAKAQTFWRGVAEDDGLRRGDPRKALLIDLACRALNAGGARLTVLQPVAAWNAWHARRELRSIRIREDDPLVIAGTPLGVRRG